MKIFKRSIGVFGALLLSAGSAIAAPVGSSVLSYNVGLAIPTGANDLDGTQRLGPMGGARYLYQLTDRIGVGGQFDYFHLAGKTIYLDPDAYNTPDNIYTGEIMARYSFMPDGKWVPYVHMGVGMARIFQTVYGTPNDGATWPSGDPNETRILDHQSVTTYAISYGGGVETHLTDHLIMGLEASWNSLGGSQDRLGTGAFNFPDIGLRLGWQFGGK